MTNADSKPSLLSQLLTPAVVVSTLGYFVDIYDLVLFSIVRVASLKDLGVPDDRLLAVGVELLNLQMAGMLIGGILWGVVGDKLGRVSVLFGSIIVYSLANIGNAFVTDVTAYGILRFIAGVGLAGELGAAITLVSETMSKETRGYGTAIVAGLGVSGAMLAAFIGQTATWQSAYLVGGAMGLMLLVMRVKMLESGMFENLKTQDVRRGNFLMLFNNWDRFRRYVNCILIGLPLWFVVGILVTFAPEICQALGATGPVSAGTGIMYCYMGLVVGDIGCGIFSQWMMSRRKAVFAFLSAATLIIFALCFTRNADPQTYYLLHFTLGCFVGYWAMFVQIAAEQFGTNLRATVTTTVPNFVRGSVVLLTFLFQTLSPGFGLVYAALIVGLGCVVIALFALWNLDETFGKDLNFLEHH